MKFHIITIFPQMFNSYFGESIIKRAQQKKVAQIKIHDLRQWTKDKHRTVDDTPYGGGAGMVIKVDPVYNAIKALTKNKSKKRKVVLLSAKGKKWNQQECRKYSKLDEIILVCGRYEGVDERVKNFVDEEISIGDYVLTGGEPAAMVVVDSITRLLPGALGNKQSPEDESHSLPGTLEYPQYTKPEVFHAGRKKYKVPDILLSGNHAEIEKWRKSQQKNTLS
jgi:tRNA (guanine37-N1)-methyltransferase